MIFYQFSMLIRLQVQKKDEKGIDKEEQGQLSRRIEKLKKRMNRRIIKLARWVDMPEQQRYGFQSRTRMAVHNSRASYGTYVRQPPMIPQIDQQSRGRALASAYSLLTPSNSISIGIASRSVGGPSFPSAGLMPLSSPSLDISTGVHHEGSAVITTVSNIKTKTGISIWHHFALR